MFVTQDIVFGVTGQSLILDAPEGRPTSVTSVSVFENSDGDEATAESATTGSAAVETNPNTTVDAASGPGQADPRVVNLTATTGVTAGRRYLLAQNGLSEWVEPASVSSGVSTTARHPLQNAYSSGATFVSTRMSISVDSTFVAERSNLSLDWTGSPRYRVRWVYVVSGVTYVRDAYFDLHRYVGDHHVTPIGVDRRRPGWIEALPTHYRVDQGMSLINEAYEEVKYDLRGSDLGDETVADAAAVDLLVKLKAIQLLEGMRRDTEQLELASENYQKRLDSLIKVVRRVETRDQTGAAAKYTVRNILDR